MKEKTVASTRVEMSEVMQPSHANLIGKVFGGAILSLIDVCAYTTASKFAGMLCVTASFDRVDFHEPIEVGEFVRMVGHVSYVGRTSVEVTIEVFAEDIYQQKARHTNTARVTMVALKENRPAEVPRLICETRDEKLRFLEGRLRREIRTRQRAELSEELGRLKDADDARLDSLLAGAAF